MLFKTNFVSQHKGCCCTIWQFEFSKFDFQCFFPENYSLNLLLSQTPVGWGSTYCFTDVSVRISVTPINKGIPALIYFGMCFVP